MCRELDYCRMKREHRAIREAAAEFITTDPWDSDESFEDDDDQPEDPNLPLLDTPGPTATAPREIAPDRPPSYNAELGDGPYDIQSLRAPLLARSIPASNDTPVPRWDPEWEDLQNTLIRIDMLPQEVGACPPPLEYVFDEELEQEQETVREPRAEHRACLNDSGHNLVPQAEVSLLFRAMARIIRQNGMSVAGIQFMSSVIGGVPYRPPRNTAWFLIRPAAHRDPWLNVLKDLRRKCVTPWLARLQGMLEEQVSFTLDFSTELEYQHIAIENHERDIPDPDLYVEDEPVEEEEEEEQEGEDNNENEDEYGYDDGEDDSDELRRVTFDDQIYSVRYLSREQAIIDVARDLRPDAWQESIVFGAKTAFRHADVTVVLAVEAPHRGALYAPPMIPENLLRPSRLNSLWR